MSDGAHLGVSAGRALETVLGGNESPDKDEQATRGTVYVRIMAAPTPDGGAIIGEGGEGYSMAADAIARAFLTVANESPELPLEMDTLWEAVKKKWPNFNDWIGGASGFQVGWAANCVRWLKNEPPKPNPAIIEIE